MVNCCWSLLPEQYRVRYTEKNQQKKINRTVKRVEELKSLLRKRKSLENMQKHKKRQSHSKKTKVQKRKPSPEKKPKQPTAPMLENPDEITVENEDEGSVFEEETAGANEFNEFGETKRIVFKKHNSV